MGILLLILTSFMQLNLSSLSLAADNPFDYPFSSCLTCGDGLGDSTVTLTHSGRLLKFCCIECVGSYTKSPETHISNLMESIRAEQRETYPLTTCVISGHELGSMGDPVEYVHGNTLVKFCCAACIEDFKKNPTKHLAKLDEGQKPEH